MKTQTVWACLTRAGVIARDMDIGKLVCAQSKRELIKTLGYYCYVDEGVEQVLRRRRWRIAKLKLTIEEVKR